MFLARLHDPGLKAWTTFSPEFLPGKPGLKGFSNRDYNPSILVSIFNVLYVYKNSMCDSTKQKILGTKQDLD